jgi:hypothetical protein
MNLQEKQFKDGFNSGYYLAGHDPELFNAIYDVASSSKTQSEYIQGLGIGHDVYHVDKMMAQNKEELGETKTEPVKDEVPTEKLADNYQKGFNSGYFLSKYEPEIAEKIFGAIPNQSEYSNGMYEGKNEHEMEKIRDRLNEIAKNKQKDDKELDKDR